MQHIAFVIFAIVIITIAAYAMFQYGLPANLNLSGISQISTSTAPTTTKKTSPAPAYSAPAYKAPAYKAPAYSGTPKQTIDPSQIPSGFSLKDISPYFGKMRLSVSPGYYGSYSQISIYDGMQSSEGTVNVTGWLLRGNRGNQYVPKAVSVYNPSGLTPESDIYLKNGDVLTIYSTYSVIGVNFRMNKCIGYLANTNKFNPPLYQGCPYLNRSEIINFTGQCQNYILSLGSCQMPAANPPIPINDYSCAQFLSKLNYGGCFEKHRNDYDFLKNQWYAWSGSQFLDFQHDRLLLFDRQGLLVTEYAY